MTKKMQGHGSHYGQVSLCLVSSVKKVGYVCTTL